PLLFPVSLRRPRRSLPFPYTTLFRSQALVCYWAAGDGGVTVWLSGRNDFRSAAAYLADRHPAVNPDLWHFCHCLSCRPKDAAVPRYCRACVHDWYFQLL